MNTLISRQRLAEWPWFWSFVATTVSWLAIGAIAGRGVFETLQSAAMIAPYVVIVGVGQLFVITSGNGNIDLSIPYTMTFAAYVVYGLVAGNDQAIPAGLALATACGLGVAAANIVWIFFLRIPPIVATLATGLMVQSLTLKQQSHAGTAVAPLLRQFTLGTVLGIPLLAVVCVLLAALAALILHYTVFGRSVQAVGQSIRAADLAGVHTTRVAMLVYVISGVLAALAGVLLAANTGASLQMSDPYLLNSIAVVVLGGSLIAGGKSNLTGVWGGALFLTLLVTLLNVLQVNIALQNIIKGVLIILVLALAGDRRET